jgi:MFS family permease
MMFVVPLYFQVTANACPSAAGFYLVPAIMGNTVGGLLTGHYIKKTGRYKLPTNAAAIVAGLCHVLMVLRWTGNTGAFESTYIFLGGLGTGIAHSSTFIAITAETTNEEIAIAGAGLYLSGGFGSVAGVAVASSTLRVVFKSVAKKTLKDQPGAKDIISQSLRDVEYLSKLQGHVRAAVSAAYVWAFRANFGESS